MDLQPYIDAFPEDAYLAPEVGAWKTYIWNDVILQAVQQLPDGRVVRLQDTNEDILLDLPEPDLNDPYLETFDSLQAMIDSDIFYETAGAMG